MYIYLSKILPLLVLPIGVVIQLLIISLFFLLRSKRTPSAIFLVTAIVVLWVSSMPIVADTLLGRMEQQFPAVAMAEVPERHCIVLLGGAVQPVKFPRVDVNLSESADRVYKASSLYRAGKGQVVIVAGGNQPWSGFEQTEAEATRNILIDWGVPDSAIVLDAASRNTRENAVNTGALLKNAGCQAPLLVTSAAHMKRAVASFAKINIDVFPVSADIRVVNNSEITVFDLLPDQRALGMTSSAIREWIGQKVYQLRGWN